MGNKLLYFDCSSGISGDMTAAALLDLGADREVLERVLESLPLEGYQIQIKRVRKSSLDTCSFDVILDSELDNHDHDMEYLHGHEHSAEHGHEHGHEHELSAGHEYGHGHEHGHTHDHGHEHTHEHAHEHGHEHDHAHGHEHDQAHEHGHEHDHAHGHAHIHRNLADVTRIIDAGKMTENARKLALRIFRILAEAESKAHGVPVDEVHFHEVGAVDSIVDVVTAAVCMDNIGVDRVIIPSITEGCGTVRSQHGILSIPVPAVTNIACSQGLVLHFSGIRGELVTPTGAAIAAAIMTGKELPERFVILKTGLGAGKREYECAGILRVMLLEEAVDAKNRETGRIEAAVSQPGDNAGEAVSKPEDEEKILCLETNIDDCSGEALGFVMEELFQAGARDVFFQPVYMKKNRPGWLLTVLCMEALREEMEDILFRDTTTIGIRRILMDRTVLERREETVQLPEGTAQAKICRHKGKTFYYPEYESIAALCKASGKSFQEIYQSVCAALTANDK